LTVLSRRLATSGEVGLDHCGEQRRPVLLPLAVSNPDLLRITVNAFDPKTRALHESETGAVHPRPRQPWDSVTMSHNGSHFRVGQEDGEAAWPPGGDHAIEPRQVALQDVFIQKERGARGLILR
jgi:hypothetical protein